mmetsp:Transcript_174178/g.558529  ORF Transcript_174178/g.558529 Transcript_174178/m.558529 type:complete len:221 (-) Transcript_174178:1378-2040(-)
MDGHVQVANIDSQFKRVCRNNPQQLAGEQFLLQATSFLSRIAASVGRHTLLQVGPVLQMGSRGLEHDFHHDADLQKTHGSMASSHRLRQDPSGLVIRGRASAETHAGRQARSSPTAFLLSEASTLLSIPVLPWGEGHFLVPIFGLDLWRVPYAEAPLASPCGVIVNGSTLLLGLVEPQQLRKESAGIADRSRTGQESRLSVIMVQYPTESPKQQGDVGAE